ncbi:MAG: hypothetical protein WD690_03810 [Vicinamibacterales bacterium]
MRAHLELLGRLHLVWGGFGLLAGVSLLILAAGAALAPAGADSGLRLGAIIIAAAAVPPFAGGALSLWASGALGRRDRRGRLGALALALPNLFVLPFGTALGIYSYWVLLNDQVRALFEGDSPRRFPAESGQ